MKKRPTKKGDKFPLLFDCNSSIFTVSSFFGRSGIKYATYVEALADAENTGPICVENTKYGGACDIEETDLVA